MTFMNRSLMAASALAMIATGLAPNAVAQTSEDTVIAVGSQIKRKAQEDFASPVANIGDQEIASTGAKSIADLTQTLTINTGAENNPDAFTQNGTTGTSNINLRGLGVQSTLILLNGRRQVLSAATTNGGFNFVDTASLVPLIAIDNVEILKDGASATYGSDAVAGVVNFSTFQNYDGVKLSANYQTVDGFPSDELLLQGLFGKNFDNANFLGAISYTDRSPLTTEERRLSRPQDDTSSLGNPGAFFPVSGPLAGNPLIDPGCAAAGGFPNVLAPGTALGIPLDVGFCGFDFGDFFNLVAEEERLTGLLQANIDFSDNISWTAELTYADNVAIRGNSPTFPFLQTGSAFIPASHPNFDPTLAALTPGGAVFFGRAIGNGGDVSPNVTESDTYRFSTELEGSLDNGYDWRVSLTRAANRHIISTEDTVVDNFQCALSGTCAATGGPSGFFNPFSSSFTTAPNSPEILDFVIDTQVRDSTSALTVVEAVVSKVFDNGLAVAVGGQFRGEDYDTVLDPISNADGFGFLIGDQDFEGDQDVYAVFAEAIYSVNDQLEFQLAGRFEDYGGSIGSTFDPKAAVLFRPTDAISLRGSVSTSFRSPSVFQQFGQSTVLEQVADPANGGAAAFVAARTVGSEDLTPEESTAFNIGATFAPDFGLEVSVDYFSFDFSDVIIAENTTAVLNADPLGPDVIRVGGDGTAANPGTIVQINKNFVNASSVQTSGIDFDVRYTLDTGAGTFVPFVGGTFVTEYDLDDPQAGDIDGAGNRNFTNFGTSVPELRFNAGIGWQHGPHSLNGFARHISGYDDDQNPGEEIDAHTTFDAQYKLRVGEFIDNLGEGTTLTLGVINATDEDPPQVFTNGGFDSKVHDPRGRLFYIGADIEF